MARWRWVSSRTRRNLPGWFGCPGKGSPASAGYPVSYQKGYEITMTPEAAAHTYVAGAKLENGKLLTSGGRVTGTTAVAGSLADAIREAYRLASGVQFENAYRRSDIGQRALQAGNH